MAKAACAKVDTETVPPRSLVSYGQGMNFWSEIDGGRAVTVNVTSRQALLQDIETRLRDGRGFAVSTLNLDHVVKLRRNPAFAAAYLAQTHVTADGNPIVWLLRLAGRSADLVTGSDLVDPAAALAARLGLPAAMLGSTSASLAAAGAELARRHPGFATAAAIAPPMGFDPEGPEADAALARIAESGARLCFLALGAPKQEILAARGRQRHPEIGFLSIGAGLDFVSGSQRRAPPLVRWLAAEWIWRLATDPRRLAGRYAACAGALPGLAVTALRSRGETAGKADA
jgi:N-acetylglucosaminyldiphosphoundecaprenol N-acetyl-beta-D-mannosaminyltransferase